MDINDIVFKKKQSSCIFQECFKMGELVIVLNGVEILEYKK